MVIIIHFMQSSKQSVNQSIKNIKVKAKVKESVYYLSSSSSSSAHVLVYSFAIFHSSGQDCVGRSLHIGLSLPPRKECLN
jgi:hypothetical protein